MIIVTDNGAIDIGHPSVDAAAPYQQRFRFGWVGSDGQEWDLFTDPVTLMTGARGFGLPTPQHWLKQGLGDGAWWDGARFPPRDVFMPIRVRTPDFLEVERAFFAGLDPRTEGRLKVTTPDAQVRQLVCRYVDGAEGEYEVDPLLYKRAVYGVHMIAADPFWLGDPVSVRFPYPDTAPRWFGSRFPLRLAPSEVLGAATLTNPGDVDAYPIWRVEGPFSSFNLGIGDSLVSAPALTKAAGQWVEIDGNPRRRTVLDETGTDLWDAGLLSEVAFAPIPPGDVALTTSVAGAAPGTAVSVSFTPHYLRAW